MSVIVFGLRSFRNLIVAVTNPLPSHGDFQPREIVFRFLWFGIPRQNWFLLIDLPCGGWVDFVYETCMGW